MVGLAEHRDITGVTLYRDPNGSIPLFLIAIAALSDVRKAMSLSDASRSVDPATIAVLDSDMYVISFGIVPTKSTPCA